jgi:signal transduction histidine kinase
MNLKFRFAALFTLFVAIILAISSVTIYLFYYNYRENSFYNRLRNDGVILYQEYINAKPDDTKTPIQKFFSIQKNADTRETFVIYDSTYQLVYRSTDAAVAKLDEALIKNIHSAASFEYAYTDGLTENIAFRIPDTKAYIIVSDIDRNGFEKLNTLKLILGIVWVGGLLLTLFTSIIFVKQALKPLHVLSNQMKQITEMNLAERLDVGSGKTEMEIFSGSFNAMLGRLNQAFESQKSFVHHASHELRTPLATMLAQTESALRKNLTVEDYQQLLTSLREDQIGLIDLTNSLLLLSQYEKILTNSKWPLIRIDEIVYDAMSASKKMLTGIDVDLQFANIPDNADSLLVKANEALLKVAFTNLIKNAWQYSSDKKVTITIDIAEPWIKVYFENHGEPLASSEVEKLKVPFFRGNNSTHVKGFGLGLSIVQRIVTLHHGELEYNVVGNNINRFSINFEIGA